MHWRVILSYFALTIAITAGQSTKPAVIEGVVTSSTDGQPVRKAVVTLREMRKGAVYLVTADTAGQFRFGDVEPGRYQLYAERQGYMGTARSSPPIIVAGEQQSRSTHIELTPLGVISGRVLDSDGEPIIGAQVRALHFTYDQRTRTLNPTVTAISNDLGEYELADLLPERYYILAKAPPLGAAGLPGRVRAANPEEAYPLTFYPGVSDLAEAPPAEVAPGARLTGLDFRLKKMPAFHIRGSVPEGNTNQMIELRSAGAIGHIAPPFITRTKPDGTFDFPGVSAGSYVVFTANSARHAVTVGDRHVDGVVLSRIGSLEMQGVLRMEGQNGRDLRGVIVNLQSIEPGASMGSPVRPDGSFAIAGFSPAVYCVEVLAESVKGSYVKSIRFGDQDARSGAIDLTNGAGRLEIILGSDPGQLQGSVQNEAGEPVGSVLITVVPGDEYELRHDLFKSAWSASNGAFSIQSLAPGDYRVWAWEQLSINMAPAAEIRKAFEARAVSVSIKPGAREKVQLKPITLQEFEAARKRLP